MGTALKMAIGAACVVVGATALAQPRGPAQPRDARVDFGKRVRARILALLEYINRLQVK